MSFLNQRKRKNDQRNDIMINLHESYTAELGFNLQPLIFFE